jgi:hypothetical protein
MSAFGQGLSAAGYGAGEMYAKQGLADQLASAQLERDRRLAELKQSTDANEVRVKEDSANRMRAEQGKRVDDQVMATQRGLSTSNIADPSSWTSEQQAAVDQSLEQNKDKFLNDPKLRQAAATRTGDITAKDAALLDSKSEADSTRLMLGEQRNQTMAQIAAGHDDTRKLVAGMVAASKTANANKEDRVLVHQFLGQFDRKIGNNQHEIRSLRASLKNSFDPAEKDSVNAQIAELTRANKNLERAQMQYAKDSGVKVPEASAKEPEKAAPPADRPPLSTFDKK